MKIVSWNVNGLRAIEKRDFLGWFLKENADILCVQETKLQEHQVPQSLLDIDGYYFYGNYAQKKGYSGVAIYSKLKPKNVIKEIGFKKFDDEGRMIRLDYENFVFIGLYVPNGGREKENMDYKIEFYNFLLNYLKSIKSKKIILAGDFNVAKEEIDLARPNENKNSTMFTPNERLQIDKLIKLDFVDTFRKFNSEGGNYSWWPYFANARERNLGWRIDYVFISKTLSKNLKSAFIDTKTKGSDHCPVGIDIDL